MSDLIWRKQGREINGYSGFLRPYRIVPSWIRSGFIVRSYLRRPFVSRRRRFATVEEAKAWAASDHAEFHEERRAVRESEF